MDTGLPNAWVLGGGVEDLPELDTLPAVGSDHSDILPSLDNQSVAQYVALPALPDSCFIPQHDQPAVGGQKKKKKAVAEPFNDLPLLPGLSSNGSGGSHATRPVKPATSSKKKAVVVDQPLVVEPFNDLPLLPDCSCNGCAGSHAKKKARMSRHPVVAGPFNDLPVLPG